MNPKWVKEKSKLEHYALVEDLNYEEIGKIYKCSGYCIRKNMKSLGIKVPLRRKINDKEHFNKGLHKVPMLICENCGNPFKKKPNCVNLYCCAQCRKEYLHKQQYQKILDGDPSIMRPNYLLKNFKSDIIAEQEGRCAICGMSQEWQGKPLVFILDHIDGHASNNKRDNLRCICPNCDSQLDTYKSKNKNGERIYYRERYKKGKILK